MKQKILLIFFFLFAFVLPTLSANDDKPYFTDEKGKYGYQLHGKWLTPLIYEYHSKSYFKDNNYAVVKKNGKFAVIDLNFNNILGVWFDEDPYIQNGWILGKRNGQSEFYTMDGRKIAAVHDAKPVTIGIEETVNGNNKCTQNLLGFSVQAIQNGPFFFYDHKLVPISARPSRFHFLCLNGMLLFADGDSWSMTKGIVTDIDGAVLDSLPGKIEIAQLYYRKWKDGERAALVKKYKGLMPGLIFQMTNPYDGEARTLVVDKEILPWKKFKYINKFIDNNDKKWNEALSQPENIAFYNEKITTPLLRRINEVKDWTSKNLPQQPVRMEAKIIDYKGGKCFSTDGNYPLDQNTTVYQSVEPFGQKGYYICRTADKAELVDKYGFVQSLVYPYVDFEESFPGKPYILGHTKNKVILLHETGTPVVYTEYDEIMLRNTPAGDVFYFVDRDKWSAWAPGHSEKFPTMKGWDYVGEPNANGEVTIKYKGYPGSYNLFTGKSVSPIDQLFDRAYKSTSMPAKQKIDIYNQVIALDKELGDGYTGSALNNIGSAYEEMGNEDEAYSYYELAMNNGNKTGESNYKRIRNKRRLERISAVANAISNASGAVVQSMGGGGGSAMTYSGYAAGYGPESSSDTGSSGKGYSASYYHEQYTNWERRAKSAYESLTNLGYRTKRNGQEKSGSTMGSMSGGNYVRQKQCLREAQNQMQKIRRNANRDGVNIPQSHWETVTVNYD